MKRTLAALLVVGLLAGPALAQSKLEQAIAKAEEQLAKGKPDDADQDDDEGRGRGRSRGAGRARPPAGARRQPRRRRRGVRPGEGRRRQQPGRARRRRELHAAPRQGAGRARPREAGRRGRRDPGRARGPGARAGADAGRPGRARDRGQGRRGRGVERDRARGPRRGPDRDGQDRRGGGASCARRPSSTRSRRSPTRDSRGLSSRSRSADAVASAKKATELDDKFGEAFAVLGPRSRRRPEELERGDRAGAAGRRSSTSRTRSCSTAVGKIFEVNGQLEQAAGAYRKALTTDPPFGPARFALIQAEINRGNRDAAIAEAKKILDSGAGSAELLRLIGEDAVRRGDFATAIPYLEKATQGLQGNADGWALLGRAYHGVRPLRGRRRGVQEGGRARARQRELPRDLRPHPRPGGRPRPGPRAAAEGHGHAGLQGRGRLDEPRLGLSQPEQARGVDRGLPEGARARPQAGAGGPRPRLGLLLHEGVRQGDRGLQPGDPDRPEERGRRRERRHRVVLLLQAPGARGEAYAERPPPPAATSRRSTISIDKLEKAHRGRRRRRPRSSADGARAAAEGVRGATGSSRPRNRALGSRNAPTARRAAATSWPPSPARARSDARAADADGPELRRAHRVHAGARHARRRGPRPAVRERRGACCGCRRTRRRSTPRRRSWTTR